MSVSLFLNDAANQSAEKPSLELIYKINGAKDISLVRLKKYSVLQGFDNGDVTQTDIDEFLGSSSDVDASLLFGSTAMGVDALAFVLRMQGQAKKAVGMEVSALIDTTVVADYIEGSDSALPDTLTQGLAASSLGELEGRIVVSGLDAAVAGHIKLTIYFDPK